MPPPSALLLQRLGAATNRPRHGRSDSMMALDTASDHESSDQLSPLPSPPLCTPPISMAASGFGGALNPRSRLLRRSSSVSTLGSMHESEDELELDWTVDDLDRLRTIYDRIVDEAMLETPFIGTPPSQLLHAIARACKKVYGDEWTHSIAHTRTKAFELAKERLAELQGDAHATPRPGELGDVDATPKRRRLCRNDSMDFLPFQRDLASVTRLSDRLNRTNDEAQEVFFSARQQGLQPSLSATEASMPHTAPLAMRFGRSMSFADLSSQNDCADTSPLHLHSLSEDNGPPLSARPAMRTGSGYIPSHSFAAQQQQHGFPIRPSLYALPSYAGSTESTRLNDSIASSIYGSSFASITSFLSSAASDVTIDTLSSTAAGAGDGLRFFATPNRKRVHEDSAFASPPSESDFAPSSVFSSGSSSAPSMAWSSAHSSGRRGSTDDTDGPVTPSPCPGGEGSSYFPGSPSKSDISYFSDLSMSSPEKPAYREIAKAPKLFIQSPSKSPEGKRSRVAAHARSASAHLRLQNSWILPQKAQAAPQLMTLESPFDGTFVLPEK